MSGDLGIEQGTLTDFFELIGRNLENRPAPLWGAHAVIRALSRLDDAQSVTRARANAAHHYDLSYDLYRLFLDREMHYSCAYFEDPSASLETAQAAKVRHIISKLHLADGQAVLDIGCGWGALALEIARAHDVRVTGITLSKEQLTVAQSRAKREGLDDRVSFELLDYRQVEGCFDRIVSVGMFEHVGPGHFEAFFGTLADRLTEEGVALIHSIGARRDGGGSNAWMRKYIFPGGYIPTVSEAAKAVEGTGLWITDMEILRLHYALTLDRWLERFTASRAMAAQLYDERFCRMWEFYLASCAMAFRYGDLMVMQIQLARKVEALPITRDYMRASEERLKTVIGPRKGECASVELNRTVG